ncbi:MAG: sigma-54 dependent transcriptional regulator [Ignavibacteriota bacterium]
MAPHFRVALVTGPTGCGKELVANALHKLSPWDRNGSWFVIVPLAETLFESELFGYVKGAFTGATQDRIGLVEYANGGTLFLDEVGDMPLPMQAKLLRVLQNHELQRVGSPEVHRIDIRVVAATNRDLQRMIAEKQFREDLYFRLAMVEITIPRLADRREDLPLLEQHFLARFAREYNKPLRGLTRRAQAVLSRHSWPGNVRELENVIGNACMMAEDEAIDVRDLPEALRQEAPLKSLEDDTPLTRRRWNIVTPAACSNGWAAIRCIPRGHGISRATLYSILREKADGQDEAASHTEA